MNVNGTGSERLVWIDLLRAVAIVTVVLIHGIDLASLKAFPEGMVEFALTSWLYFIGRLGVPVFLLITGALLLADSRAIEPEKIRTRLFRVCAAYALYLVLGLTINLGLNPAGMDLSWSMLRDTSIIGYINGGWYLRYLIVFYIFLPLFHRSIRSLETRRIAFPVAVGIVAYALTSDLNRVHPIWFDLQIEPLFIFFVLYPILGYLIHDRKLLAGVRSVWLLLAIILPMVLHVVSSIILLGSQKIPWVLWYNSGYLFVSSAAIFEWVRRAGEGVQKPNRTVDAVAAFGRLAFSIYIVHLFFMYPLFPWLPSFGFLEWTLLSASLGLCASILLSMVLLRVPGLRTILR